MSHQCIACKGSGRISNDLKSSVKLKGEEVRLMRNLLEASIEGAYDPEVVKPIKELLDRLHKPMPVKEELKS